MSNSNGISTAENGLGLDSSPRKSDNIEKPNKFITKLMALKKFDTICIILAEVLGTATLLFLGCAGTVHWNGAPPSLLPPLNFGLTVMMIIQIFGHISYALLNPAVTICAVVNNLFSIKMGIVLSVAQIVGAILGYGLLQVLTPEDIFMAPEQGTCMTVVNPKISVTQAFFVEFFLTSALITMVCGVWDPRNRDNVDSTPVRVGLSVFALSIAGGPFTDASMNPARTLGPALWTGNWDNHWIYWIAPLSAGLLASLFYRIIFWRKHPMDEISTEVPLNEIQKNEV